MRMKGVVGRGGKSKGKSDSSTSIGSPRELRPHLYVSEDKRHKALWEELSQVVALNAELTEDLAQQKRQQREEVLEWQEERRKMEGVERGLQREAESLRRTSDRLLVVINSRGSTASVNQLPGVHKLRKKLESKARHEQILDPKVAKQAWVSTDAISGPLVDLGPLNRSASESASVDSPSGTYEENLADRLTRLRARHHALGHPTPVPIVHVYLDGDNEHADDTRTDSKEAASSPTIINDNKQG